MTEGSIILAPVSQSDGTIKNRPALVLREMPRYRNLLVCGVSTQLHQRVDGFDEVVAPGDADFTPSGLQGESLIRLGYLALIPRRRVLGSIGAIDPSRHKRLLERSAGYLVQLFASASAGAPPKRDRPD